MKVIDHYLCFDDGKRVKFIKSPHVGAANLLQEYVVIHYTGSSTADGAISWMTSPRTTQRVSAHLHIDREGNIVQMAKFDTVCWHAGVSKWENRTGLNSYSIGIELQNLGHQPYPNLQMESLIAASKAISEAYPIKEYVGHNQISPGRKVDPGPQFPWEQFNEAITEDISRVVKMATKSDLHLREGGGTNFKSITVLKKGTEVNVLQEKDNWAEVFICSENRKGWVSKAYLI